MSGGTGRTSRWLPLHATAVLAFLYLPIVTLIVYSFNGSGVGGFPPRNLTLDWYRMLFSDDAIWTSVLNSILVRFRWPSGFRPRWPSIALISPARRCFAGSCFCH